MKTELKFCIYYITGLFNDGVDTFLSMAILSRDIRKSL